MADWLGVPDDYRDHLGFIYIISHTASGAYYIGKKQFFRKIRRRPLKGKRRARLNVVESDWRKYWGSSKLLLAAIEERGEDAFTRRILETCDSKFQLAYRELQIQLEHDVLNDPKCFNGIIHIRLQKSVGDPLRSEAATFEQQ